MDLNSVLMKWWKIAIIWMLKFRFSRKRPLRWSSTATTSHAPILIEALDFGYALGSQIRSDQMPFRWPSSSSLWHSSWCWSLGPLPCDCIDRYPESSARLRFLVFWYYTAPHQESAMCHTSRVWSLGCTIQMVQCSSSQNDGRRFSHSVGDSQWMVCLSLVPMDLSLGLTQCMMVISYYRNNE